MTLLRTWVSVFVVVFLAYGAFGCLPEPGASSGQASPDTPVLPSTSAVTTVQASTASSVPLMQATASAGMLPRDYAWQYGGSDWTWSMQIPEALYDYYRALQRPPTRNYSVYVTHPLDDTVVDALAGKIADAASAKGYSSLEAVELAASFVQNLRYTSDSVTTGYDEYPRYPVETLVDRGGDCEDKSILLASLLDAMGYGVVLIIYPGQHAAVGVAGGETMYGHYYEYGGGKYYYLETTAAGWGLGEMPETYLDLTARVYDMTPVPVLTHDWTGSSVGPFVTISVAVQNLGSASAKGAYILAGFDAGNDMLWNSKSCEPFDLEPGYTCTVRMTLTAPADEHTRLVVQIVYEGYAVDESYSEWVDT